MPILILRGIFAAHFTALPFRKKKSFLIYHQCEWSEHVGLFGAYAHRHHNSSLQRSRCSFYACNMKQISNLSCFVAFTVVISTVSTRYLRRTLCEENVSFVLQTSHRNYSTCLSMWLRCLRLMYASPNSKRNPSLLMVVCTGHGHHHRCSLTANTAESMHAS